MPGYYQRPIVGQLPLTPPDSGSGYGYSNMHYGQDPYSQAQSQCRQDGAYDFQPHGYMQPAAAPPTYQYQPNNYQNTTSLPPISNFYEPIGAPILPPLRINERLSFTDDYQQRLQQEQQDQRTREQQRQVAKEEKATGGVSAHLDYEMDTMTDFVCSAVSSIFHLRQPTAPQFRKWVHQVLSATRLPAATILLSLYYLNDRMIRFPTTIKGGDNEVYRLLAVALILGSKFLDDNTFINRSWSDVTAIKVIELNRLEAYWLQLLEWRLHIDSSDESLENNSFRSWSLSWEKHQYDKAAEKAAKQMPARLSPLDTNLHCHAQTSASRDRYSAHHSPYTASSSRSFEQPQPLSSLSARSSQFSTPYSSVDPWAPTSRKVDDYYKQPSRFDAYAAAEAEEASRRAAAAAAEEQTRQSTYQYRSDVHQSYYQTPVYNNSGWDTGSWGHHQHGYSCQSCQYSRHYSNYGMSSSYATQPVMG